MGCKQFHTSWEVAGGAESELVDYISFHFFYSLFMQAYPDSVLDFKLDEGPDIVLRVGASVGLVEDRG